MNRQAATACTKKRHGGGNRYVLQLGGTTRHQLTFDVENRTIRLSGCVQLRSVSGAIVALRRLSVNCAQRMNGYSVQKDTKDSR